ncbi:short hydrophobic protein [Alston virus]|uniref:Short hydrophobic protein n=1 Tax=Alston virus TaxID=2495433 RepID=A0A3Q8S5R1_9MONO|nr:short hydrophobic protein [Alston virus]AZK31328.1 short hydrophobic protein [Alston virus]
MLSDPESQNSNENTKKAGNFIICLLFIFFLLITFIVPAIRYFLS